MMAQPLIVASVGIDETPQNRMKAVARCLYYSGVFWKTIRDEKLRPPTNPDGSIVFSANLYRRFCNSARLPGEPGKGRDVLMNYFKTGKTKHFPK